MGKKSAIARAAAVMSGATFISRVLGYVKDMILARYFGATASSDVFFVAFRIPNLLRELFAEGSMSSAFVPVLAECQTKQGRAEANSLVRSVFFFILLAVGTVCLLGILFAPAIVTIIAPGFAQDPAKFSQTVLLTRIMFPFLLFVSLASLIMGSLNVRGVFFIPASAPAVLNIVTIVCIIGLSTRFVNPVIAVAIGVSLGGLTQFLFQMPAFLKLGFTVRGIRTGRGARPGSQKPGQTEEDRRGMSPPLWHPGLRKIGRLVLPTTVGLAVAQINIFVSTILASYLAVGSITYLYYSMRLIQFPIGIFGVAMGMAVLPALSEHAARGNMEDLKEDFSFALRLLLFITIPAMVGLMALRFPIVSTLFQWGKFDTAATVGTADALLCYSLGIWAIVGVRVLAVSFYALQETSAPVKTAVVAMTVNIVMSLALMGPLKHNGLALANSIAAATNFILLFVLLRRRLGGVGTRRIALSSVKTLAAAVVMGGIGWLMTGGQVWRTSGITLQKGAALCGAIVLCLMVYIGVAYLLRCEELSYVVSRIKGRFIPASTTDVRKTEKDEERRGKCS